MLAKGDPVLVVNDPWSLHCWILDGDIQILKAGAKQKRSAGLRQTLKLKASEKK